MMELTAFSRYLFSQKSSMVDVQLGSKYAFIKNVSAYW